VGGGGRIACRPKNLGGQKTIREVDPFKRTGANNSDEERVPDAERFITGMRKQQLTILP